MIAEAVKNANVASSPGEKENAEVVKDYQKTRNTSNNLTYARITAAAAVAAVAVSRPEDGWQVVSNRRRKSTSSTTLSEFDREVSVEKEKEPVGEEPLDVYERLSSTSYKRGPATTLNRTLTCPRSAMDLPQTRASMAKMAYSRQLLWEKNQQVLVEKLRAKQKREKISSASRSSSQCGFTFADPQAVRKSVEAFNQQKSSRRSVKENTGGSQTSNTELQSINETAEDPTQATSDNSEDVPADPTPSSSISQPPKSVKSTTGSLFGYVNVPEELEKDDEWKEMTEEEESLALEENSLNLEIKQAESISIDAELERQVEAEAETLERAERKRKREKQREKEKETEKTMEQFYKVFQEIRSLAWSEMMEQESLQNVHEPGTPVEKHEKMSSPSRRRCQKDDGDFGRRHELKQKNAEALRAQLQEAKAQKLKELTSRVEEVRKKQEALKERKRRLLEERMQRAAENRDKNIMEVIRRAKDDDQRVAEVKFIATLQEDTKRYDLMQQADERARKQEDRKRELEMTRKAKAAEARRGKPSGHNQNEQKVVNKTELPSDMDMLTFLHSLCSPDTLESSPIHQFPSTKKLPTRECTLCPATLVRSDFEAATHLICSKEHQEQARMLTSGSLVEELKRHFYVVFNDVSSDAVEDIENAGCNEEIQNKAREALKEIQISDTIPGPVTSPRNRTKYVREFNLAVEKIARSTGQVDEKTQETMEKSLAELLSAVEDDMKSSQDCPSGVNLDQFCAINGPQKITDLILEWTSRGASLRLCIRMCHAFCTFLRDPHVAYAIIFKPELLKIVDRILRLKLSTDPQLSALLDILAAILKAVNTRIDRKEEKKHQKSSKELLKLDAKSAGAVHAIGELLRSSINDLDIQKALEQSKGTVLCSRLISIAEQVALRGNSTLLEQYSHIILNFAYSKLTENQTDLTSSIVSTFCQTDVILKTLLSKNRNEHLLMLVIIFEDYLWRCAEAVKMKMTGVSKNRSWGVLSKEEEKFLKAINFLDNILEQIDAWQMRSLTISWTGRSSCLQILEDVPIRLLAIGKHADRLVPTVQRILERFTNSERAELLGNISADFFFDSKLFPGRKTAAKYVCT
uniref:S phase cyclin A-associated protein in the endoplasmic reticulum N-terminal domain-containing protein n=1 Tax=Caenorhabditis japonica TaxID=281687 RepID=A0A8R1HSB2_CAEJA